MYCGNNKKCHVTLSVLIWNVELGSFNFWPLPPSWDPFLEPNTPLFTLLEQGYSHHQIHNDTDMGMSTISRIGKEMDSQKENNPGGYPSKLSAHDKQSIVQQFNSGKLDNAVQAANFINSTSTHPVHPQTVRNALKAAGFYSATKEKVPMLKLAHHQRWLKFAQCHRNWTVEDLKRVLWSDKTKIDCFGSNGKVYVWKQQGEPLSDHTTTPTVKHGGNNLMVWGCMGWNRVGKLIEVQGKMNAEQYCQIFGRWDGGKLWEVGDGGGWMLLSAGQWHKTHIKASSTVVWRQQCSSIGVACTISWPKSHWTPLASSQISTSAVWGATALTLLWQIKLGIPLK